MDTDELSLKLHSLLRRAGVADVSRPVLIGIIAIGTVLILLGAWHFWPRPSQDFVATAGASAAASESEAPASSASAEIVVDVEGAVANPGLYALAVGSRVGDAIEAAGGFTSDAQPGASNLAQKLSDGEQVIVSSTQDAQPEGASSPAGNARANGASSDGKININTASAEELQALSGVGPSLSERIVEYREANGRFSRIEDLQNVSGIGETRFANIKDKIRV